jgi:hypothetical protein
MERESQINPEAENEIKSAKEKYRELIRLIHPDVNKADEAHALSQQILEAKTEADNGNSEKIDQLYNWYIQKHNPVDSKPVVVSITDEETPLTVEEEIEQDILNTQKEYYNRYTKEGPAPFAIAAFTGMLQQTYLTR